MKKNNQEEVKVNPIPEPFYFTEVTLRDASRLRVFEDKDKYFQIKDDDANTSIYLNREEAFNLANAILTLLEVTKQ